MSDESTRRTLEEENEHHGHHEQTKKGFKAFLQKFSFGDTSVEGDEDVDHDPNEDNHENDGKHTADHQYAPSSGSKSRKLRHALSFGHRREAGLHGGAGVRWYHNLFPLNQKFEPRVEYPLWDDDWWVT